MARGAGISGTAVGLATAGGLLMYAGLKDVSLTTALRQVIQSGTLPSPAPTPAATSQQQSPTVSYGPTGSKIADAALAYEGKVPYKWGGADPSGWDCSGFVSWVLHHDLGYSLPSNVHTVCTQFLTWSGATAVKPPMAIQAGDLVVWTSHMGIAVSPTEMISAENPRAGTKVDTFRNGGPIPYSSPVFLRVKSPLSVFVPGA